MVIAITILPKVDYSGLLLKGILSYAVDKDDIQLYLPSLNIIGQRKPKRVDGVISLNKRPDPYIKEAGYEKLPLVALTRSDDRQLNQVHIDSAAVCKLAFEHFRQLGVYNLAYLDNGWVASSSYIRDDYRKLCHLHSSSLHVLNVRNFNFSKSEELMKGIQELPKPAGVLMHDRSGKTFIDLCRRLDLRVPEDIQVLGINNIPELCFASDPILSSIDINIEEIGYQAVSKLVRLIKGEKVEAVTQVNPRAVVQRDSTKVHAEISPEVSEALKIMHANLAAPVEMEDLLYEQDISRRTLEKLFKKEIGQSPMAYLRSVRMNNICQMLKDTNLSAAEIGRRCGIPNMTYLCRLFKRDFGQTPLQYRESHS